MIGYTGMVVVYRRLPRKTKKQSMYKRERVMNIEEALKQNPDEGGECEVRLYYKGTWMLRTTPDGIEIIDEDVAINALVGMIQENLTDDLLRPEWRNRPEKYAGHCYVASECFYHLYGKDNGWKPMCGTIGTEDLLVQTHWWLEKNDKRLDITAEQFPDGYDYSIGRKQFFVNYPSKRCLTLAERVIKGGSDN